MGAASRGCALGGVNSAMAVFVDDAFLPFGRMKMCHMVADSDEELIEIATRLGLNRKWHQHPGTYRSHFDVCSSKRRLAIDQGATPITWRELAIKLVEKRERPGATREN